ncbi:hypothetical protein GGR34_003739 [Microvirga flocculans]|uniref:Uncharacterized protein n=1 Tax=Microvirga flocculans TaxID=217168 RepID=A0A7W6IIN4_9HYPH|nr:hypothetical protein [Microvirga flocculans]MBB4042054.1 hypothetical protein [Microvirga flocculans]
MTETQTEVKLRTTQELRERLRELSDVRGSDDYDRAVVMLLDDFERMSAVIASQSAEIERLNVERQTLRDNGIASHTDAVAEILTLRHRALAAEAKLEEAKKEFESYLSGLTRQSRRVRNFSNQDEVFEAVPLALLSPEIERRSYDAHLELGEARKALGSKAAQDVLAERRRQIEVEGWTAEHDDQYRNGELAKAAVCYALAAIWPDTAARADMEQDGWLGTPFTILQLWPWDRKWWKPKTRRADLVKSAALALAAIERLDRAALLSPEAKETSHG